MHTSRVFSCSGEWRMTAPGTSSHRSCHSSSSRPGRIQLWAWGRCTGSRWQYTPRNPLCAPGSEHVTCPHTYKRYVLALRCHKYQFQSQDGRTAAVLCGQLWRQIPVRHQYTVDLLYCGDSPQSSGSKSFSTFNGLEQNTKGFFLRQSHITAVRALMTEWPFLLLLAQSSCLQ